MSRIAFVFLEILSCEGGIQSYVGDLLSAMPNALPQDKATEKTTIADIFLLRDSAETPNPFTAPNLNFYFFKHSSPQIGRLKLTAALLTYVVRSKPSHLYCGHINLAPLMRAICQPLGIPFTVLTYGKEVWEPLGKSQQKALQASAKIWTISRYSRDRLCISNQIKPEKVEFLYCAVDGQAFQPQPKPQDLILKYSLEDSKVLMTVARLWSGDRYKGVDVTIRALPEILRSFPDVKYLILGRGDDQPRLAALAVELGVSDRVVFAGFVATEALVAHYNLADAYVMPSQEGFGIVYLEALACGVPVLSGDADGSAEPLQDGRLGWRVPHRDPDAVAMATIEMLKGSPQRTDGEYLRSECLKIFDKGAIGSQLAKLLA
jgi:phosphatidyl-myo-inositol dimannoside synthase